MKAETFKQKVGISGMKHIDASEQLMDEWKVLEFDTPEKCDNKSKARLWMNDVGELFVSDPYWFKFSKRMTVSNGKSIELLPAFGPQARRVGLREALEWIVEVGSMTTDADGGFENVAAMVLKVMYRNSNA